MLKAINKIPAGTFLVPLIVSMILFTFWPNLFHIGGLTESLLTSSGTGFISAVLSFSTGTRINIKVLKRLLKHQGVLLLTKVMIALILSFAFLAVFGTDGFLGVSSIAFVGAMFSLNPAVQVSILDNYGYKEDSAIMGLSAAVTLPMLPLIVFMLFYSNASLTELDWMPIVSALLPFLIGITLGNLDPAIGKLFGPLVGALLPFLGWNLGQSMNLKDALSAGLPGLLLTLIFIVIMSSLYLVDRFILKKDGISALAMMTVAGISTVVAPTIAEVFPHLQAEVTAANSQILLASIITSIFTPLFIGYTQKNRQA